MRRAPPRGPSHILRFTRNRDPASLQNRRQTARYCKFARMRQTRFQCTNSQTRFQVRRLRACVCVCVRACFSSHLYTFSTSRGHALILLSLTHTTQNAHIIVIHSPHLCVGFLLLKSLPSPPPPPPSPPTLFAHSSHSSLTHQSLTYRSSLTHLTHHSLITHSSHSSCTHSLINRALINSLIT